MIKRKGIIRRFKPKVHQKHIKPKMLRSPALKRKSKPTKIPKSLLAKADSAFSKKILRRDGKCQWLPHCEAITTLQCSHFIGRAVKNTRFDEDNCIALCWWHHYGSKLLGYEFQKQQKAEHGYDGQYTKLMKSRLGTRRWNSLLRRSRVSLILTRHYLTNLIQSLS